MKILMTNTSLGERAGSESYLETVAFELRRLGHEVVFFSTRCGFMADRFREDGFTVVDQVDQLPGDLDVVHGQHADTVALVRTRLAETPLVFACHSWFIPVEDPMSELGAAAYVCFNELTHRRLAAHAATAGSPIVRMTQPVTISFADSERVHIRPEPRSAVAVSRRMMLRPDKLAAACVAAGIDFDWVGAPGAPSADPRDRMRAADIVFAEGRTALEAMSAGRAVYVVAESYVGGWVTEASYPRLEADGFTGIEADFSPVDLDGLAAGYHQYLGVQARQLAVQHHSAQHHAVRLVELYTAAAVAHAPAGQSSAAPSAAVVAAERFGLEKRAVAGEWLAAERARDLDDAHRDLDDAHRDLDDLRRELEEVRAERDKFRRQRNRARRALERAAQQPRLLERWRRQ